MQLQRTAKIQLRQTSPILALSPLSYTSAFKYICTIFWEHGVTGASRNIAYKHEDANGYPREVELSTSLSLNTKKQTISIASLEALQRYRYIWKLSGGRLDFPYMESLGLTNPGDYSEHP